MGYVAPWWLKNRHLMTVYGHVARLPRRLSVRRERWELDDGDFLDVDRMAAARPDAATVIVCHGLEGSSRAGYVRGLLRELRRCGLAAVAWNFRGCASENRLLRFYHSGDTSDLERVIARVRAERPGGAIGLAGFSLGGNVVTKYLGERGDAVPAELRAAAVVSVPFDLAACQRTLDGRDWPSVVYRQRFLRRLKRKALAKAERFAAIDTAAARRAQTLHAFDEAVTAPLHGFASADDYYARSSSAAFVSRIRKPLLVVQAADDPFIPESAVPKDELARNPHIVLELSSEGGHVAFAAGPPWRAHFHAERRVAAFLAERLAAV
jgi:predicted alpha/beta-fold hydrolase